jgi:hypothetical protein
MGVAEAQLSIVRVFSVCLFVVVTVVVVVGRVD